MSRRTSSGRFVAEIDGLRFVAIGWVVIFHHAVLKSLEAPAPLRLFASAGHYGVELFFVISGFVLAVPFARMHLFSGRPVALRQYYLRRLTRLEPPYVLSLFAFFVAKAYGLGMGAGALLPHLGASLLYQHGLVFGERSAVSVVAWSLEVEVQFYLLAPVLGRVFCVADRRYRRAALLLVALASAGAASFVSAEEWPRYFLSLPGFLQYFILGYLLADLYLEDWLERPSRSIRWDALGVVCLGLLVPVVSYGYAEAWGRISGPFLIFGFYLGAFRGAWLNRVFSNVWIYTIGGMCYTIYLYHTAVLMAFERLVSRWLPTGVFSVDAVFQVGLGVLLLLVTASALFVLVERPCMNPKWPAELYARMRRAGTATSQGVP